MKQGGLLWISGEVRKKFIITRGKEGTLSGSSEKKRKTFVKTHYKMPGKKVLGKREKVTEKYEKSSTLKGL